MKTVRTWEYTQRFGHVGLSQNSQANNARVLEYFSDSYVDQKEAVQKAELFLCIYDYIGRNAVVFRRKGLLDQLDEKLLSVNPALLRAVHFIFTRPNRREEIPARKVLNLARAFEELDPQD